MRHFPLGMHKDAEPAARAMQAAHRQGKGFEMADLIFANMRTINAEQLAGYASQLSLDVEKFKSDWESDSIKKEVADDLAAGQAAGVRGTPSIFVNGRRFQGQRTLEGFKEVIDAEIKKADELIKNGTPLEKVYETRCKDKG
jgi:predicted DsbA family dithiol-disulfide isomerase